MHFKMSKVDTRVYFSDLSGWLKFAAISAWIIGVWASLAVAYYVFIVP